MKLLDFSGRLANELTYVALDTETTGLGEAYLVEVAGVKFRQGEVLYEFSTLINPECHIPSVVTAIHGITDEMVADAPTAKQILPQFVSFIRDAIPIAHNASFDVKMLAAELYRADHEIPEMDVLDSCRLARRLFKGLPNYRLSTVVQKLLLAAQPTHRALADAHAVVQIFERCLESLTQSATLEHVLKANGKPYSFDRAIASSQIISYAEAKRVVNFS